MCERPIPLYLGAARKTKAMFKKAKEVSMVMIIRFVTYVYDAASTFSLSNVP